MREFLSILSGALVVIATIPYLAAIWRDRHSGDGAKPVRATWLVWFALDGITFRAMATKGTLNWQITISVAAALTIFLLSISYGKSGWTITDKICLGGAGIGIILLLVDPRLALGASLSCLSLGAIPTFKSTWARSLKRGQVRLASLVDLLPLRHGCCSRLEYGGGSPTHHVHIDREHHGGTTLRPSALSNENRIIALGRPSWAAFLPFLGFSGRIREMAKVIADEKLVNEVLSRGVEEIIEKIHLKEALLSGKELRIKFGIDPTASEIHLGHLVALLKLRQFQRLGHKIILIIGDFTAKIGDPSGRSETRKPLSEKEIKQNFKKYKEQLAKILDMRKVEIQYNSKWLNKGLAKILEIISSASLQQVMRRADFQKRIEEGHDITMLETLYPVFQGYDSVAVKADLELGGTDQKFNLLMGRRVQRFFKQEEQDVMTVPLLVGTDGVKKMSKSYGNYIGVNEKPEEMFAKIMSVPDELLPVYFELLTDRNVSGAKPYEAKRVLARTIVSMCHDENKAAKAEKYFEKTFSKKEIPDDAPELILKDSEISLIDLVLLSGVAESKSEARRLIEQGAVEVGGRIERDIHGTVLAQGGEVVRIGKKYFARLRTN